MNRSSYWNGTVFSTILRGSDLCFRTTSLLGWQTTRSEFRNRSHLQLALVRMTGRNKIAVILLTVATICGGSSFARSGETKGLYLTELELLRSQRVADVGKTSVSRAYEHFISKYTSNPQIAETMLELASIYEAASADQGIKPERESAMKWYRKAAETAKPGSKIWFRAQFLIIGRLRSDTAQKRKILISIIDQAAGDSLTLAKVENHLMIVSLQERSLGEAEEHTRRILHWYRDSSRVPTKPLEKVELDTLIRGAARTMVHAWENARLPKAERILRIEGLVHDFQWVPGLLQESETALESVRAEELDRAPE
jgi:hypothetical protein